MGLDIGPKTAEIYADVIKNSKLIIWNGPMGVFEMDIFAKGTKAVAEAMADTDGYTIIGGGDSAAAVEKFDLAKKWIIFQLVEELPEFMEGKVLTRCIRA